jgi:hypothetical protein
MVEYRKDGLLFGAPLAPPDTPDDPTGEDWRGPPGPPGPAGPPGPPGPGGYILPIATTTVLGGVMVDGVTVLIDLAGVLRVPLPVASSSLPIMDGAAAIGVGATWARADHVHPSDTSRYAASNPAGYQTAAQVTAALPIASSSLPIMDGAAAIGAGVTWARADHVHPSDTSRLPIAGGTLTGALLATTTTAPLVLSDSTSAASVAAPGGGTLFRMVGAAAANIGIECDAFGTSPSTGGSVLFLGRVAQGTSGAPTLPFANQGMFVLRGQGWTGSSYSAARASVTLACAENWSATAQGSYVAFQTTAVGGTVTAEKLRLTDAGALQFNVTGPLIVTGAGVPAISAPAGSLFLRTDGAAGTRLYVNQNGAATWAAVAGV